MNIFSIPMALAQDLERDVTSGTEATQSGISDFFVEMLKALPNWIAGGVVLVLTLFLAKIVSRMVTQSIIKKRGEELKQGSIILIGRVVSVSIFVVGLILSLQIIGLEDMGWLLGAIGVGIGFSLKDLINNFISGMVILMNNEINIGDIIAVEDIKGTIVDIQIRATILQSFDGTKVTIPNGIMLSKKVTCYTANPFRRIDFNIGISFESDIEKAKNLAWQILCQHQRVEEDPSPDILVTQLDDSAVNLKIRFWVKSRGSRWLHVRSELIRDIKAEFDKNNIEIPFPITTLHGSKSSPVMIDKETQSSKKSEP